MLALALLLQRRVVPPLLISRCIGSVCYSILDGYMNPTTRKEKKSDSRGTNIDMPFDMWWSLSISQHIRKGEREGGKAKERNARANKAEEKQGKKVAPPPSLSSDGTRPGS